VKKQSTKFPTALGVFTVIWTEDGITEIRMPGSPSESFEVPSPSKEIPDWLEKALTKIGKHLEGKPQKMDDIPLDLSQQPAFHQKVYRRLVKLPPGQTVSYGQLAELIGAHGAARAVGTAMSTNPIPIVVPCHRVVKSDGSLGNYSALEGPLSKRHLLEMEGCDLSKKSKKKKMRMHGG